MSAELNVEKGPFAGNVLRGNLTPSPNDITTMATVDAVQATQVFLETFKPTEGWTINVTGELIDLSMVPLPNTAGVAVQCPTALFKAALSKDGVVYNQASTLWVLSGPTEWEKGETNARLRLYAAMGLPVRQDLGLIDPIVPKPRPSLTAVPSPYKDKELPKPQEAVSDKVADSPEVSEAVETAEAPKESEAEAVAPAAPLVLESPSQNTPTGDAPAKAVVENIRRICNMRGIAMPTIQTKAEAETVLKQLLNKGA